LPRPRKRLSVLQLLAAEASLACRMEAVMALADVEDVIEVRWAD
jgi:hypothetical protein